VLDQLEEFARCRSTQKPSDNVNATRFPASCATRAAWRNASSPRARPRGTLEEQHLRTRDQLLVEIVGTQLRGRAEEGVQVRCASGVR